MKVRAYLVKMNDISLINDRSRLILGFITIILIVISLGVLSQIQLTRMSNSMESLYKHPYTVSNATEKIKFNLVAMHRAMKDVVLSNSMTELDEAINQVTAHEVQVLMGFDVLFDRYLGDKQAIKKTYKQFLNWQPIRKEVIQLIRNSNYKAAIKITKGKGAEHVAKLNQQVQVLNDFAHDMALKFQNDFHRHKQQTLYISYTLTFCGTVLVMILALYILSSLRKADKERKARKNLIDQNIMISTLDRDGKVIDASNALCRFLGVNKNDLIGELSYFFDNSEKREQVVNDISTRIHTGSEWRGEIQHLDKQGRLHWAQSTIVPNFDDNYKITKFTNILISITNKKLSSIDTLTSLLNRRSFDEILVRELLLAQHNSKFITLAILDIDHFKKYNDCYGHPQGDDALKRVSQVLLSVMQDKHSYAFRIGGEEFAILLVGDDESESKKRLQKVKDNIEALHIIHEDSPTGPHLTISIGAHVLLPTSIVEEDILYITADKALYQAKKTRNTLNITSEMI